jgi:alpha-glucosidase
VTKKSERHWWQQAVIYEIYLRSFQDSDGDGVGDLAGILARVDYLAWLGVDAVWLTPFYPSPMADFGYDVADYVDVDPLFGTLADFDRLVEALHRRDIRIILDFVPNHTSVEHLWFKESRTSRASPKRNWYIWRDGSPGGAPPNNWQCFSGGSGWELDQASGQFYYHSYLREQPDLNWHNREMRAAIYDALRFWLDRGVDGIRVDVLPQVVKDPEFRDDPIHPGHRPTELEFWRLHPLRSADQPEAINVAVEMRQVLEEYSDELLMIGETYLPVDRLVAYYGPNLSGAQLPFNFNLLWVNWSAEAILRIIRTYEAELPPGAWPSWVLGNHDQMRIASRLGPAQARVAMVLLLTLRGTPTLYYGDELGLEDVKIQKDELQDPFGVISPGGKLGRDPERTPMPWDRSLNAGFTTGEPWLPLGDDHPAKSVEVQKDEPDSMLSLTRALLALRRREPALALGDWVPLETTNGVLSYSRTSADRRFIIALNLDSTPKSIQFEPDFRGAIVLSTDPKRTAESVHARLHLGGDEAVIVNAMR